jgi:hypothetical protein
MLMAELGNSIGIASELWNISGDIYLSGHWKEDLIKQLG